MLQIAKIVLVILPVFCSIWAASVDDYYIMNSSVDRYDSSPEYGLSLLPGEYRAIIGNYSNGRYRLAILQLREMLAMGLPDGRMDAYLFLKGESYRALGMDKIAVGFYRRLSEEYPGSPFRSKALFRLVEHAYTKGDDEGVLFHMEIMFRTDSIGEMADAVKFTEGKRLYRKRLFADAEKVMASISDNSPLRYASLFIRSLCAIELNNYEKALLQLDAIIKGTKDKLLSDEAKLVAGQLYIKLKRMDRAEEFLAKIDPLSPRYGESLIFLSQIKLYGNDLPNAIKLGEILLTAGNGEYIFEAAMVLESAYLRTKQDTKIDTLRSYLETTIRRKKLTFDVYKELDQLSDAHSMFGAFCNDLSARAITLDKKRLISAVYDTITAIKGKISAGFEDLLRGLDAAAYISGSSGVYELRFLEQLDKEVSGLERVADSLTSAIAAVTTGRVGQRDPMEESRIIASRDSLMILIRTRRELRDDIRQHSINSEISYTGAEDAQAKFIDWSFMHLDQLKVRLSEVYREIGKLDKASRGGSEQ